MVSPYLINDGIDYNNDLKKLQAGLYFNVQGKTLEFVGNGFYPDVYTMPFNSLNFNFIKFLRKNKSITIKVSNLLGSEKESLFKSYKSQDRIFKYRNSGNEISISFTQNF